MAIKDRSVKNALLAQLRNMGSHRNNLAAVACKSGDLQVAYRHSKDSEVDIKLYIPCPDG
jgi:hypothetical protein